MVVTTGTRLGSEPVHSRVVARTGGIRTGGLRTGRIRTGGLLIAIVALVAAMVASLVIGSRDIPVPVVLDALVSGARAGSDAVVVLDSRLPRTLIALAAGAALAIAGALVQAVTRNPLADPGLLGVTSGSAFAVAIAVGVLGITAPLGYIWFAFGGALVATVVVYLIGASGRRGGSPLRLILAGVALGAVLSGIISALLLADPAGFTAMRAWESGSLEQRGWEGVGPVAPFVVVGAVLAFALAPTLNAVALGDDLAASLGANIVVVRTLAVIAVTLLAGGATALAGPILFLGLMIPHVARLIVGPDQRWILAYSAVLGPILLLAADIVGRVAVPPGELPAGIVTACIGAPVLIALVRRQRTVGL